ncbi:MAG: DNA-3-methyladenine glycosylase [Deltaproteobacteria bacterium]|nr:DNA-3-methyladenine glycosylase [Deltaproteobacteria bacterium]MBW2121145.1 DNA-3-methyladenine glycosylase [Deltaproteobacteria bacterium]
MKNRSRAPVARGGGPARGSGEIGIGFFGRNTLLVAQDLLGKKIEYRGCTGIIVETEAYRDDPASHSRVRSKRTRLLRETYGSIYVYLAYGIHVCLNFTTEADGAGAVLVRAVEPLEGIEMMELRRKTRDRYHLTNGPGRLCQAFGIGMDLFGEPVGRRLKILDGIEPQRIQRSRRIGISRARDLEWRFFIPGSRFVGPERSGRSRPGT